MNCTDITEDSPANIGINVIKRSFDKDEEIRHIGLLCNIHHFCRKYELGCHTINKKDDILEAFIDVLQTLAIKNEFRRVGENNENTKYTCYSILLRNKHCFYGCFTDEESKDILSVDPRIKLALKE